METLFLAVVLFILLAMGVHIAIALGISSALYLILFTDFSLSLIIPTFFKSINSITLMAIPMFILSGIAMERLGIMEKLFYFADSITRWLPGGTGVATMISCMFFAAISGSSVAGAAAMGVIAIPNMKKRGYDDSFASGIVSIGGTLAILIPPSISMIIYGVATEMSIPKLFMAGMIPGIILGLLLCSNIVVLSWGKIPKGTMKWSEVQIAFKGALGGMLMPGIVLGGIYGGIFTPTEAAAIASTYAIIYGLILKKSECIKILPSVASETLKMTAMIFLILGGAFTFAMVLTIEKIPHKLTQIIIDLELSRTTFLIALNILYLILGCFLDVISCILLTIPIIFPIVLKLGIDPLHFAVLLTVNMEIACITPPVGFNLYVVSGIAKIPIESVVRGTLPFYMTMIGFLILVTWFPDLSTWLVEIIYR